MQRVLDLDLDFFLDGFPAHHRPFDSDRLDAEYNPPWSTERAVDFLTERCQLRDPLPGWVVEHHGQLFPLWRDAIAAGVLKPPFEVTHVDAHADLGLGDVSYVYLMTDLLFRPLEERRFPKVGDDGLTDGNWLSFAVACRWLSSLTYVFNREDEAGDIHPYLMEGGDPGAEHLQLAAVEQAELDKVIWRGAARPVVHRFEPRVPFRALPFRAFTFEAQYDFVCLARSPAYTPAEADVLFDELRTRFIDESAVAAGDS